MSERKECLKCGHMNGASRRWCKNCKVDMMFYSQPVKLDQPLTPTERNAILQKHISHYVAKGYRVQSQTETTAQLIKPKQFSLIIALLGLLVFVFGLFVYILIYMAEKDKTVFLTVDEYGNVATQ